MPRIYKFECDTCGEIVDIGEGDRIYVIDKNGERIIGAHSMDFRFVKRVLRESWGYNGSFSIDSKEYTEILKEKTGKVHTCICRDCLKKFEIDVELDEFICPACNSENVCLIHDFVGNTCPKCKEGKIRKKSFGIVD